MVMYSPDGTKILVHPSQIENMIRRGWTKEEPNKANEPIPAEPTENEVNSDG